MNSPGGATHPAFPEPRDSVVGRLVLSELTEDARTLRGVESNIIKLTHMVDTSAPIDLDGLHQVVDEALSEALETRPAPPDFVTRQMAEYAAAGIRMPLIAKMAALELTEGTSL